MGFALRVEMLWRVVRRSANAAGAVGATRERGGAGEIVVSLEDREATERRWGGGRARSDEEFARRAAGLKGALVPALALTPAGFEPALQTPIGTLLALCRSWFTTTIL